MGKSASLAIVLLICAVLNLVRIHAIETNDENVEYKLIETTNGVIRGQIATTIFKQKRYYSFRGIPFAQPPIETLRFKTPQPANPWAGVRDVLDYGPRCVQVVEDVIIGNEDCLYLNVFVPETTGDKLPVMFYIHGGGYNTGTATDEIYGPDFLVNEDVILVTASYRLGIFGFLSLGSPEYSGNMGMKDQLLALKWINENAAAFGADRNRITVVGHSAGGSSAHFHTILPASQDYFQRSIMMSGTVLNTWALSSPPVEDNLWAMFLLVHDLNQTAKNDDELKVILQTVPYEILAKQRNASYITSGPKRRMVLPWTPTVESDKDVQPFLLHTPEQIYENFHSNKEAMFGFTANEMYPRGYLELQRPHFVDEFNENFHMELPFKNNLKYDSEEYQSLAKDIREFYFGEDGIISNETAVEYNDLFSDVWMVYGIDESAKLHAKKSAGKTYYYRFSLDTRLNHNKQKFNVTYSGSGHADEICYLFRCHINPALYDHIVEDSTEYRAIQHMTKLWTNFVKYGNPTPNNEPVEFLPIDDEHIHFLDIQNDGLVPAQSPHQKHIRFWTELHRKYEEIMRAKAAATTAKPITNNKRDELYSEV